MTVADAVGMAKSGPDKVAKFRRMELKRASDADVARQHAEAKATENAALDANRLAAAAVIQAAVLRWATRRQRGTRPAAEDAMNRKFGDNRPVFSHIQG